MNIWTRTLKPDPIDDAYQAEIDRSMERGRLKWESEQSAMDAAERRRERLARKIPKTAREKKITKRQLRLLDEQIEMHRKYLQDIERLMIRTGAPATSRGTQSFRPIPKPGGLT